MWMVLPFVVGLRLYKEEPRDIQEVGVWETAKGVRVGEWLCALAVLSVAVAQCHPCSCCYRASHRRACLLSAGATLEMRDSR